MTTEQMQQSQPQQQEQQGYRLPSSTAPTDGWIRGVNIGGWLLAERFITPYLFAVNTCHLEGELCWYEGQIGAPTNNTSWCDPERCQPVLPIPTSDANNDFHPLQTSNYMNYPIDELTLGQALDGKFNRAQKYMERHWDTFVTKQDLVRLKEAGVTHMRVPMGYWIRNDILDDEPWIPGGWPYFVRFAKWCREVGGLTIWADLHGAPGSENGFDNSGQYNAQKSTCEGWSSNPQNVARTALILQDIANGIVEEDLTDIVKGFGILNEPFLDCDEQVLRKYYDTAFHIIRDTLGDDTAVFVGDMFRAWKFNNGFWVDDDVHHNTYLDSHPYQVFFERGRSFTPRQHIAYTCRHTFREVTSCCYEDAPRNTIPAKGISRIVGEWSAAYDQLPTALTPYIMKYIVANGKAPLLDRQLSQPRRDFMEKYVKSQMVTYEAAETGLSSGWLFWNFKMEGGAFAEWDFLRGIREGWIPKLPDPMVSSESLYGSCYYILNQTSDNDTALIVDEYPDPQTLDWNQWQGWDIDDDFVINDGHFVSNPRHRTANVALTTAIVGILCLMLLTFRKWKRNNGYTVLK